MPSILNLFKGWVYNFVPNLAIVTTSFLSPSIAARLIAKGEKNGKGSLLCNTRDILIMQLPNELDSYICSLHLWLPLHSRLFSHLCEETDGSKKTICGLSIPWLAGSLICARCHDYFKIFSCAILVLLSTGDCLDDVCRVNDRILWSGFVLHNSGLSAKRSSSCRSGRKSTRFSA